MGDESWEELLATCAVALFNLMYEYVFGRLYLCMSMSMNHVFGSLCHFGLIVAHKLNSCLAHGIAVPW